MVWLWLIYPWLELFSLLQLGAQTSALTARGWVVVAFFLGGALSNRAGNASTQRLREAQSGGVLYEQVLVDDLAWVFAGLLLIIPGLMSDLLAVVLLIRPLRRWLADRLKSRPAAQNQAPRPVTLEGDFTRVDDPDSRD